MMRQYLQNGWILKNERVGELSATVPGCVHTDLVSCGKLQDIFWRDNSKKCQWIEDLDWEYECVFDAEQQNVANLVFEGLDTYAEISLNETVLGKVDNMFIPHVFDVSDVLKSKNNVLKVHFYSPIKAVEHLPLRNGAFTRERMNTRRVQCTYGWDWVDRFVTCGIFRDVYLEYANGIEVENVYVYTENIDSFGAQICAQLNFKNTEVGEIATVEIISQSGNVVASTQFFADQAQFVRRFDIQDPELWYPSGYGEQPLYVLRVSVGKNTYEQTFGIRTLKILQLVEKEGSEYDIKAKSSQLTDGGKQYDKNQVFSGFSVIVNGKQIFCRGGNWVPCEPFPAAESDAKIIKLVQMAKDMGANFLRVWGGGLFEKQAFYDECDRCGILVAQDFLMACGEYPEKEQWFIDALIKESEFAAKYLRNHPCLAWWHGDNENATGGSDTQKDYTGRDSALKGIAPQIYKYDYTRQILPSSPYGGDTYASLTRGTSHTTNYLGMIFDYFDTSDCKDYKEYLQQFVSRFISEEGTLGAISRPSMLKFMTESDLLQDEKEEMLIFHTKNNPYLKRHIFEYASLFAEKVLGKFADAEDRYFKYKYIQYEWARVSFENVRRNLGYCNGLVFWMFNDCWPAATGWAFVDYYSMPKHSYYAFVRGAKPIIGSIIPENGKYQLFVSSDNEDTHSVTVVAHKLKNGIEVDCCDMKLQTKGYGVVKHALPLEYEDEAIIVCNVLYDKAFDRCFYKDGTLPLVACDSLLEITQKTENSVTLSAKGYIHCVELEGECLFEDNCFSMLSGETRTINAKENAGAPFDIRAYSIEW